MVRALEFVLLATICLALTFHSLDAWSCSPGWSLSRHSPTAGTQVPSNAVMHLVGPLPSAGRYSAHLTTTSTSGWVRTTTLAPETFKDFSLWGLDDLAKIPLPNLRASSSATVALKYPGAFPGTEGPVINLQIGPGADLTSPSLVGTPTLNYRFEQAQGSASCYPWDRFVLSMSFSSATDDFGVAVYGVYERINGQLVLIGTDLHVPGEPTQSIRQASGIHLRPDEGQRCFAVMAYDYAGNASLPAEACIDMRVNSTGPQPDAGVVPSEDAGYPPFPSFDAGHVSSMTSESDASCGCASTRQHPEDAATFFGLLVAAGLIMRRRTSCK